jgi:hypothetical protein
VNLARGGGFAPGFGKGEHGIVFVEQGRERHSPETLNHAPPRRRAGR